MIQLYQFHHNQQAAISIIRACLNQEFSIIMAENIHLVTDMNKLQELRYKKKPIVLEFYTEWCPPCKPTRIILQKEIKENAGKFLLICINCDEAEELSIEYEIEGVPTVIALSNDDKLLPIDKVVGYDPKKLKEFIDKVHRGGNQKKI